MGKRGLDPAHTSWKSKAVRQKKDTLKVSRSSLMMIHEKSM